MTETSKMTETSGLYGSSKPLRQRIDAQARYGTRDLTAWFLDLAAPGPAEAVLDIGCGSGNHLIPFAKAAGSAVGIDSSEELVASAQRAAREASLDNVRVLVGSGDAFDLEGERFDIAMCNFAIYYMDAPRVIELLAAHLKPDGRAYVMGSPDENARELMEIHGTATAYVPGVYAPGYSDVRKYEPVMRSSFAECVFHRFENPVVFPSVEAFMSYYLGTTLFQASDGETEDLEARIAAAAKGVFEEHGEVRVTKIVDTAELRGPKAHG